MNLLPRSSGMVTLLVLLSVIFLLPAHSYPSSLGDLRISLIDGDVQIKTAELDDWVPAGINTPLDAGDVLWVPEEGKAGIQLKDGSYIRLNENTSLEILRLEDNSFQFYLNAGEAYVNFRAWKGSFLQIDTSASSLRTYDPSTFNVGVVENGPTRVSVFKGRVDAENEEGKTTVNSGNSVTLGEDHYAEFSLLGPPDEWERWNMDKDRKLERRLSERYLPEELRPYSSDFDESGKWVYVKEYGYVWSPMVVVSAGWAPYRVGRWVWIRGDYVWVSHEPWGWAPYHYGRWAFGSIGWFWVPPARGAVYWGPGFVGWVQTPTYVSWVPLAPREIYYGHGYYGPHSVNITNINITNINVKKVVYRNVHVQNSVTVIHHDTFVRGTHVDVRVKENPFLREKISIGRPDIKPERATRMPMVKEIPDRRRPPEVVRDLRVKEIREKRPLVKERQVSVLNPHSPPRELEVKHRELKPGEKPREDMIRERGKPMGDEKPKVSKPRDVKPQRQQDVRSPEKGEMKPSGKGVIEKPGDVRTPEKRVEKPREFKPEKGVERPKDSKPADRELERPKVYRPAEAEANKQKPREMESDRGAVEKTRERGNEKPRVRESKEKGQEKPQNEKRPDRGGESKEDKVR